MALQSGTRLGAFEIASLIGEGGMGQVYRARDTRLNRVVALKVIPGDVAADAERLARFRREAQVLAALNHPHIAQVHGFEEADGPAEAGRYPVLVMEFIEGEDLAQRIARGRLPYAEALPIARQIAEALEAAHESGIVHRDLKPANIKLKDDGTVKVLDFGLAKAIEPATGNRERGTGATLTTPAMTQAGVILGTAAYMSPEQAKGRPVDKRTDVWAFGCVLFEMITGTRAFEGEDVTETLASVLRADPDWSRWPAEAPAAVKRLTQGCLERDRRARVPDIGVARYVLAQPPAAAETSPQSASPAAAAASRTRGLVLAAAAFAIGAALAATGVWRLTDRVAPATSPPAHFRIALTPAPFVSRTAGSVAIAADGSFFVYPSLGSDQLYMRAIDELESKPIAGTSRARDAFISPDGKWVAFFSGPELKRVPVAGGVPQTICTYPGAPRGGVWSADGSIVFASSLSNGLLRVAATGGTPARLTTADPATQPQHVFPALLPGGGAVLFNILERGFTGGTATIAVADIPTGETSIVAENAGLTPLYLPSGHLLAAESDQLRVATFDLAARRLTGDFVPVAGPLYSRQLGVTFAVSDNGVLVYTPPEGRAAELQRSLVWVDRQGRETALEAPPRAYEVARVSPDLTRVAVDIRDQENDIWIWDIARQTLTLLPAGREDDLGPVWSMDGQHVWYTSNLSSIPNVYRRRADGTGTPERVIDSPVTSFLTAIAPGHKLLVLFQAPRDGAGFGQQLAVASLGANDWPVKQPKVILSGKASFFGAEVSPDGRWMAYHSNEAGRNEVYVRPFPDVEGGRWQISSGGGSRPAWSRSGGELFYLDADNLLVSAPISATGATFSAGVIKPILPRAYLAGASARGLDLRSYDVAPDGQRFLMVKEPSARPNPNDTGSLMVITNWFDEIRRRVPGPK
jgi:serine/threonine-protein kinase